MSEAVLRFLVPVLILWCAFISVAMTFVPVKILDYVKRSRMWMWYLTKLFSFKADSLNTARAARWVRTQGVIGMGATIIVLYAWAFGR